MATLVYSDADGIDRSFALGGDPIVVGRSAECAIRSEDPRVSRMHARFYLDQGLLWVEDLGSSNGIYVGPNKVQRAPVPIGEIVLVGSLMIRLLPASGTLPPPMGLHGTLASWLDMERKARAGVEEERNAFAQRVGELHEELRTLRDVRGATDGEAAKLRDELDALRKQSAKDLEAIRIEMAKARDAKIAAETSVGMQVAEKLAEADMTISRLEHQLEQARAQQSASRDSGLIDQVAMLTARAEKAEKDMVAAQIRAQGAERTVAGVQQQAQKAEGRVAELEKKLADADALRAELATAKDKLAALAAAAPEARAQQLAADAEQARGKLAELDKALAAATAAAADAERRSTADRARIAELEAKLRQLSNAEERIEIARKEQDKARERAATADVHIQEAAARADEAEKRAAAADTMAKAMAKDVAEALRRAVDADMRARGVVRELDGAHRRAEGAEKRDAELRAAAKDAERRAAEAEAKVAEIQQQLGGELEQVQRELAAKADATTKEMLAKLEQAQRELSAERQTAMVLVDRKTQLERELQDARTALAGLQHRVELAEGKVAEYEVQVDQLEERIEDLESGIAVEQTAASTSLTEARDKLKRLEEALAEAKAAAKTATKTAAQLERRIDGLETDLAHAQEARATAEAQLAEARGALDTTAEQARTALEHAASDARIRIEELERAHAEARGAGTNERERLEAAENHVRELESKMDPLVAKAEAADLAIGRASALQRQLDEALQKLSWLERDGHDRDAQHGAAAEQIQVAEERARLAEAQLQQQTARVHLAEAQSQQQADRAQIAEQQAQAQAERSREIEQRAKEIESRAKDIEQRAKEAAERIVATERRERDAQDKLDEAQRRIADLQRRLDHDQDEPTRDGSGPDALERELAAARARIKELQDEVDSAENVRQFAASTEREIAQFQRELRETKAKLAQITIERDRLESQLRDVREDSETRDRRAVSPSGRAASVDPEATAMADVSRYTALVARASELEKKLSEAESRLAAQHRAQEDEPTNTGNALPIEFAEHLGYLEEAIDSLRSNMRAASDETAMMDQTDSVMAVASAVSQAAEHVERARDSVRALLKMARV